MRGGNSFALRQLYMVLQMNADIEQALIFAKVHEKDAKLAAISALGFMELGERYDEVLSTLIQEASSSDEDIALQALSSGYRVAAKQKVLAPVDLDEQLERILQKKSPLAIHLAADLLWLLRVSLRENAVNLCLKAIVDVDPKNIETIARIDYAIRNLVGTEHFEKAICVLRELFDRSEGKITLDAFQNTYHALQEAGSDVLGSAIVYWLLNGDMYTHKCVASEVCRIGRESPPFSISKSSLPSAASDQLFLCRKAIGWFFINPLTAIVIPLAVLRDGSPDIKEDVLNLIYKPLILSYDGKLKEYLKSYIENDGVSNSLALAELLARKRALKDAMEGIERLVELHPSEMQRETDSIQSSEQMKRSMEQARQKSIFEDLVSKKYVLYGRSSLTPVYIEGNSQLSEVEMRSFSVSSERPLLSIVDPVGLDYMLIYFRHEPREQQP